MIFYSFNWFKANTFTTCYNIFVSFKQKLEHRQKQVFSQSLQQSVRILELPILELRDMVEAEITENPAVEEAERQEEFNPGQERKNTVLEQDMPENPIPGRDESLTDFLLKQLRINAGDKKELELGSLLIQHIDENGYMRQSLDDLSSETDAGTQELLKALKLIQTFEPSGVGARDLKECLLIQLEKLAEADTQSARLVRDHLEDLADKDTLRLCKKIGISPEELKLCLSKIHSLEPKPGRSFSSDEVAYSIPDIFIEEKNEELEVRVKDDVIPVIRVNPLYKNMLKSKKVNEETKEFIRERISRANNLIRAIQGRKDTLLKVVSLITETQKEAMLEGIDRLKPLSIKEVAKKTGLHESTISRVVANKYIQAPAGIFALKNLFSVSLKTTCGENVAAQMIKSKITELIESEDKAKPLKDHEIAQLINCSEKTNLARRTIAKYRESLKLPPVAGRRQKS